MWPCTCLHILSRRAGQDIHGRLPTPAPQLQIPSGTAEPASSAASLSAEHLGCLPTYAAVSLRLHAIDAACIYRPGEQPARETLPVGLHHVPLWPPCNCIATTRLSGLLVLMVSTSVSLSIIRCVHLRISHMLVVCLRGVGFPPPFRKASLLSDKVRKPWLTCRHTNTSKGQRPCPLQEPKDWSPMMPSNHCLS